MKKFIKNYFGLLIVIIFTYFAVQSFFSVGFFPMHDDTQVARVFEMGKALKDGMFPVRWVSDLGYGYGYPVFNFYAPLAYYIGGFFMFFGTSALVATKIMMVGGILLAGITMYFLARKFFGEWGGILSATFYLFAPYHAVDIYVRGDVSEFFAYSVIPMLFLACVKVFENASSNKFRNSLFLWTTVGAISYSAIILLHNLTALMITPFLLAVMSFLVSVSPRKKIIGGFFSFILLLGLLLSGFYWLPALNEMHYTNVLSQIGGGADFHDHFVCLSQLWSSQWGYGGSTKGCVDGLSFMIGKLHIIFSLIALAIGIVIFKKEKNTAIAIFVTAGIALIAIFLTLPFSEFVWNSIVPMAFFQYPWRFLLLVAFATSFMSGASMYILQKYVNTYIASLATMFLLIVSVIFYGKYFVPQKINPVTSNYYTNQYMLTWKTSKISDEYMPKNFLKPLDPAQRPLFPVQLLSSDGRLMLMQQKTQIIKIAAKVNKKTSLFINVAYFPAWHISVDGKSVAYKITNKGMETMLLPGMHTVTIQFTQTLEEKIGNMLSFCGICVISLGIILLRKKRIKI